MKFVLLLISFFSLTHYLFAVDNVKINGFAPKYIGEKVEIFAISDYFSMKEELLGSAIVADDSMFTFSFATNRTQKILLKSRNNKGFIYVQPKATYEIYFPEKNKYDEYRPLGNDVEISFINLPETDVNYKILGFEKWKTTFLGQYFYKKKLNGIEFANKLDTFKLNVEKAYKEDTSFFFHTFVRFSIAEMDNIQFMGARNRFQKYDFFIKNYPIAYDNDVYMNYIETYYKGIYAHLSLETNNRIYLGVLKSSPTVIANALGEEYTLKNAKLLELILIKSLSDSYFKSSFPQTNIISILDSVAKYPLFKENGVIARNLIDKLSEILPGSKAPRFEQKLFKKEEVKTLESYQGKHLYLQFVDLSIKECEKEITLLKGLYNTYKSDINVITLVKKQKHYTKKQETLLNEISWDKFEVETNDSILKKYKIQAYPSYVLIDAYGYVVAAPALRPTPNGKYETIDKSFYYIQKLNQEEK